MNPILFILAISCLAAFAMDRKRKEPSGSEAPEDNKDAKRGQLHANTMRLRNQNTETSTTTTGDNYRNPGGKIAFPDDVKEVGRIFDKYKTDDVIDAEGFQKATREAWGPTWDNEFGYGAGEALLHIQQFSHGEDVLNRYQFIQFVIGNTGRGEKIGGH